MPENGKIFKAACEILVHMSGGGYFHGSGGVLDGPKGRGSLYEIWGSSAEKALASLKAQLKSGAALDEHLLDQLLLPASLADGTSRFLGAKELTLHAQTAIHIAQRMVPGVKIQVTPQSGTGLSLVECVGIGWKPGSLPSRPSSTGTKNGQLVAQLAPNVLSNAPGQLLTDLRNDLMQFSGYHGLRALAEVAADRVCIDGCDGPDQVAAVRKELEAMFNFYQFPAAEWKG